MVAAIATVDEPFDLCESSGELVAARAEPVIAAAPAPSVDALESRGDEAREDLLRLAETGSDAPPPVEAIEPAALPLPPPTPDFALASESAREEERPAEMPSERPVTFELEHHESGFFSVAPEGEDEELPPSSPA